MMTMHRISITFVALMMSATPANGQTIESVAEDVATSAGHVALGDHYLSNYFRRNMEVLAIFWNDQTTIGGTTGIDSLMTEVPASWAGVEIERVDVIGRFANTDGVVNYFGTQFLAQPRVCFPTNCYQPVFPDKR